MTEPNQDPNNLDPKKTKKKRARDNFNHDILKLVARGSAIIAEILRLKDYIPEAFTNPVEEKQYKDLIFDLSYFQKGVGVRAEDKIKNSPELLAKDEDFRENNIEIIRRFYSLLYSVFQYITDWSLFMHQVEEDKKYVQYNLSTSLSKKELRHIVCESLFNAGVMLLLVDRFIPSDIRGKIIVSYYRYEGQTTIKDFDPFAKLFEKTGYVPCQSNPNDSKNEIRPPKYPIEYFKRAGFDKNKVRVILETLMDTDIYDQVLAFPSIDHKTHALSSQGSMLLITLFFYPDYLDKEEQKMRGIVDKYFNDNWVISFYMGYTIDLGEYWKEFKAARKSLELGMNKDNVKKIKSKMKESIGKMQIEVKDYLSEGRMTEEYVLKWIDKLLELMRESNVVLRWFILQRTVSNKQFKELINSDLTNKEIINLLLTVSQFEYLLKTMLQNLLDNKDQLWNDDKAKCSELCNELISYFEGKNAFGKDIKQGDLASRFQDIAKRISELDYASAVKAQRVITDIKSEINYASSYHYINQNEGANKNVKEINNCLDHMLRILSVKPSYLIKISKISDFSYAWINIKEYKGVMQEMLKEDSKNVLLLRATFLKLASILNFPLVRLFEIESEDIESVTNYYSGELVAFVKNILQIIPLSVFNIMDTVIKTFNDGFNEIPVKVPKNEIKNFCLTEKRYKLAECAHKISLFTQGIYLMEKTLMGVIEVDPKIILEDGIRKELTKLLAKTFDQQIDFAVTSSINLTEKLRDLIEKISNIKRSFLYIQDYININGSRMWCEEMHHLLNKYVELEANKFLSRKIRSPEDQLEGNKTTIPHFEPKKGSSESPTFLGRLTRYVLNITHPKNSTFYPANYAWFNSKQKMAEVFGIKMLNLIKQAIGVEGFQAFGKLISYMNYQKILEFQAYYQKLINEKSTNDNLKLISKLFGSPFIIRFTEKETSKQLFNQLTNFSKTITGGLVQRLVEIGQHELLRQMQNYSLSVNAEVDSYILTSQIKSLNNVNLFILRNFVKVNFNVDPAINTEVLNKNLFTENNFFNSLCSYFEDFGFVDTLHTFYFNLSQQTYMPLLLAVCTFNEIMNYFTLDKKTMTLKKHKNEDFDMFYFTYGIYIILYQMGKNNIVLFIALLSQLLKSNLMNQYTLKDYKGIYMQPEISKNIAILQLFLQELAENCNVDFNFFEINFNSYLMFRNITN